LIVDQDYCQQTENAAHLKYQYYMSEAPSFAQNKTRRYVAIDLCEWKTCEPI